MASQDRFGHEWKKFHWILPEYEQQFLNWVSPLKSTDFKNKILLDAGCGTGRNSLWPLKYGAKSVVAFDYDHNSVNVAKRNLSSFKNAHVKFLNIYEIPYVDKFDISYAIGVVQHLEYPDKAISQLVKATKRKGKVLLWVLGYEGNEWIVRFFSPLRYITSRSPMFVVNMFSYLLAIPLVVRIKFFPSSHKYISQLRKFHFIHVRSIVYDHLLPRVAHYWTKSEAINLLKDAGLVNIQLNHTNENSWTVIGTKP